MEPVTCPECHSVETRRIRRKGILERWLLPKVSVYPFKCGECSKQFLSRVNWVEIEHYDSPAQVRPSA